MLVSILILNRASKRNLINWSQHGGAADLGSKDKTLHEQTELTERAQHVLLAIDFMIHEVFRRIWQPC